MVRIRVTAGFALFQRPEMVDDRCSYDVITPSAARGVLECVFWHPGLLWIVDRIYVLKPIKFADLEVGKAFSRIVLMDVDYVIEAHFEMTEQAAASDNPGKFASIINRRLTKGDFYKEPYLGSAEYPATIEPWKSRNIPTAYTGITDLGYMLYDFDYSMPTAKPRFYRAVMRNGVIDLREKKKILT